MKAILQLVVTSEDGTNTVKEIASINRTSLTATTLGISLEESKQINNQLQTHLVEQQIKDFVKDCKICPTCVKSRNIKGYCNIVYRTMFGKMQLKSPRLVNCGCSGHIKTYSPLSELLVNRISPELEYIEAKWASLMSYGMSTKLLSDILPIKINSCSAFITIQKVANKIEAELGTEQGSFINMCPYQIENLPTPDLPLEVKIDGGYIHAREGSNRKAGWFEAIVGKSIHPNHATKRFAFVTTFDKKPKRRLHEMLLSQGMQLNQQITFFSDGDEKLKDLQYLLSPDSEHVLDWFHITMRLTVLQNMSNSINEKLKKYTLELLDKSKWCLWHGNVSKALQYLEELLDEAYIYKDDDTKKFKKYLNELSNYIEHNQELIINYNERHKYGETVSSAVAESTVNEIISKRMVKKQQMRWTQKGAHLLLQVRVKTLNNELKDYFAKWYPGMSDINDESIWEKAA